MRIMFFDKESIDSGQFNLEKLIEFSKSTGITIVIRGHLMIKKGQEEKI